MTNEELDELEYMQIFVAKRDMAVAEKKDMFVFNGQEVLVTNAKYVIENYENKKGIKI